MVIYFSSPLPSVIPHYFLISWSLILFARVYPIIVLKVFIPIIKSISEFKSFYSMSGNLFKKCLRRKTIELCGTIIPVRLDDFLYFSYIFLFILILNYTREYIFIMFLTMYLCFNYFCIIFCSLLTIIYLIDF